MLAQRNFSLQVTFNSIKDYQAIKWAFITLSVRLLSIPSRIILGYVGTNGEVGGGLSIPSRIIRIGTLPSTTMDRELSIPSRIISSQMGQKMNPDDIAFNSIKDYPKYFGNPLAWWQIPIFQFHQGLSYNLGLRVAFVRTIFQFHQGLSMRRRKLRRGQFIVLSIPSRIIPSLTSGLMSFP